MSFTPEQMGFSKDGRTGFINFDERRNRNLPQRPGQAFWDRLKEDDLAYMRHQHQLSQAGTCMPTSLAQRVRDLLPETLGR